MDAVARFVKVTAPSYLQSLPFPDNIGGFAKLSARELLSVVLFTSLVFVCLFALLRLLVSLVTSRKPQQINRRVKKDNPKVVDLLEVEDLADEKISYCRCWKSSKFPLCDGTHNKHNDITKDNIGPLVVRRKVKS